LIIAIASGKGGTGKTLLATGLARVASEEMAVQLLDCDVEEPNDHLFLAPEFTWAEEVTLPVPQILSEACTLCGRCVQLCQFHALALVRAKVLLFPQLCHGCGLCARQCPANAISEQLRRLGTVEGGEAMGGISFARGLLEVGQALATPVIRELKAQAGKRRRPGSLVILDAPPGNACPVIETMRGSDYVLLVTEPTPFGLHDLRLAVQTARDQLGLPVGVVINRAGRGEDEVTAYCQAEGLPILLRLPLDRRIASAYAEGILWVDGLPEYREALRGLYSQIAASVEVRP